ncbi:hypothetical protein C7S17_5107 [Burkholderia thailandensis]|nr:hypothetical protein [Burkholderia thailandensis]
MVTIFDDQSAQYCRLYCAFFRILERSLKRRFTLRHDRRQ